MIDVVTATRPQIGLAPAVRTATAAGATVDRRGFYANLFVIYTGVGGITFTGTNRLDYVAEHSDDGTAWTACETGDVIGPSGARVTIAAGTGRIESYTAAKPNESITVYQYAGPRRYYRVNAVFGGTHSTGTMTAVTYHRSRAALAPSS